MDTGDAGTPGLNDLEGAKFCGGDIKVLPCRYTDVRLGASESLLKENVFSSVPTTFGAPDTDVSAFKMEPMATDVAASRVWTTTSSFNKMCAEVFSGPAAYHVLQRDSPYPLRLELLVPAATELKLPAATLPPPGGASGGDFGLCLAPREDEFEEIETIS